MKLTALAAAVLALAPIASACKCTGGPYGDSYNLSATRKCCAMLGGKFNTDDCEAHSIKDKFRQWTSCCDRTFGTLKTDCSHRWLF